MASERVEHGKFTYRPLDPERREIRLVELSSESTVGSTGERVPLLLMHHFLPNSGNRPQYRAISYTWGSRPQNIVLIQEEEGSAHEVLVSANLADFLHFAIVNLTSSLYWIDQLSINQEDDAEKSHQVKMMVSPADYNSSMN